MSALISIRDVLDLLNNTFGAYCATEEDECEFSRGCLKFALEISGQVFLVWRHADDGVRMVSRLEEWDFENIAGELANIPWLQFRLPRERLFISQPMTLH